MEIEPLARRVAEELEPLKEPGDPIRHGQGNRSKLGLFYRYNTGSVGLETPWALAPLDGNFAGAVIEALCGRDVAVHELVGPLSDENECKDRYCITLWEFVNGEDVRHEASGKTLPEAVILAAARALGIEQPRAPGGE